MGNLLICSKCGHVQKELSPQWLADVTQIYDAYELYPLSSRSEQMIRVGGRFVSRNTHLATKLGQTLQIKNKGKILDIGCGNGGFLRAFSSVFPEWRLFGCEQQESRRGDILKLPAADGFFKGSIEHIDQYFDCISLVYVIEHIFDPLATLRTVREKLSPDGFIFIKTADLRTSPFDLAVADHCHHFTMESLVQLVNNSGFTVLSTFNDWVDKEIGLIATPCHRLADKEERYKSPPNIRSIVENNIQALINIHRKSFANAIFPLGILGTAISATWLANQLGIDRISFFVDEDESRMENIHLGAPVLRLLDAPRDSAISVPFPPAIASKIVDRVQTVRRDIHFIA